MDYQNTLKYLYESVPMFQEIGGKAYKPGLEHTYQLDEHFGHPHRQFKTIHIAGTNGKGSCSHLIAAVLQAAGYRVGLFTSPHLVDFRERIRINGEKMPEEYVVRFVENHRSFFEPLHPSFFELTTAMAFRYFADQKVDVAIVEVGMGGRLDCTNIIHPDLCIITNIGFDHMQYLGDTLPKIAKEKAGIIKEGTPVVIGRAEGEVKQVFTSKAKEMNAPIIYAQDHKDLYQLDWIMCDGRETVKIISKSDQMEVYGELSGIYQRENYITTMTALKELKSLGYRIKDADYCAGFANVCEMTGLMGRWQKLQSNPDLVCDTGHNVDGISHVCRQLDRLHEKSHPDIHIVFGMVNDKDISSVIQILPKYATYYFTKASVKRALPEDELMQMGTAAGLEGSSYPTVTEAVQAAKKNCPQEGLIFVGGSNFIVADLLANRNTLDLD